MFGKFNNHFFNAGLFAVVLAATSVQAENRLDIHTTAKSGGTAITELWAPGNVDLQIRNHASQGGTSNMRVDAVARNGGRIDGTIFGGSQGGRHESYLDLQADGPGARLHVQDYSLAKGGTVLNSKSLSVQGNSRLHWHGQQIAESGGLSVTDQRVDLRAAPGSRNRWNIDSVTDSIGNQAENYLRAAGRSSEGGVNKHRLIIGSYGYKGPAKNVVDVRHDARGAVNRSTINAYDQH